MKKMLNTLYVTTQGSYLFKEGETVAVKVEKDVRLRLPIHTLSSIVCFGQISCSPFLLGHCAENNVAVSFLTSNGRFLARIQGAVSGNVLLRREQYRRADDENDSAEIARGFLIGKLTNSISVLSRTIRDHSTKVDKSSLEKILATLNFHLGNLQKFNSLNSLRGVEGKAAAEYFNAFDHMIVAHKDVFSFITRTRRPPMDPINCLLSFVYTLLYHDTCSALETVGLDPAVGYLHRDRPGRMGLALDMMEELRPVLADRLVLSLINLGIVKKGGFTKSESGAVLMDDETRKTVLVKYQERKQDELVHPFLQEKIPVGMLIYAQSQLFARYLRGDMDAYPPLIWR